MIKDVLGISFDEVFIGAHMCICVKLFNIRKVMI